MKNYQVEDNEVNVDTDIKYYVTHDFRSYALYITVFKGHDEINEFPFSDGFKIITTAFFDEKLIDKKVNTLPDDYDWVLYGKLKGFDGNRRYGECIEIDKTIAEELIRLLSSISIAFDDEVWDQKVQKLSESKDAHEFMEQYISCIQMININVIEPPKVSKMCDKLLKGIKKFHDGMYNQAIQTNCKQLIYYEYSLPTEDKGMFIKEEYIKPNGETEKISGWEYDLENTYSSEELEEEFN